MTSRAGRNRAPIRSFFNVAAAVVGTICLAFLLLVAVRGFSHAKPAEAASSDLNPTVCLGGWQDPQHASGVPSDGATGPSAYSTANSAFLGSEVAAQIYCGYFPVKPMKSSPKSVTVAFNWSFVSGSDASAPMAPSVPTSYTSGDGHLIAPATGFDVTASTTPVPDAPPQNRPVTTTASTISAASTTSTTSAASTAPTSAATSTDQSAASSVPASSASAVSGSSAVASSTQTDPAAPTASTTATSDAQSLLIDLFHIKLAQAQTQTQAGEFKVSDFLDVSYSIDGINWTSIGTVSRSDWKDYKITLPISSWDDLKHLQVMVSTLPSIDSRPDIYLESMSLTVQYDRSLADIASDGLAAVTGAVDSILGNDPSADAAAADDAAAAASAPASGAPAKKHSVKVTEKKLSFAVAGKALGKHHTTDLSTAVRQSGASMELSGDCTKKYYVVLIYRKPTDYKDKPASYIANDARECSGGHFTYDLSALSKDTRSGTYYAFIGEEGDTGSWSQSSDIVPIEITASTTESVIEQ